MLSLIPWWINVDFFFWQACTAIMENASWIFCESPWRCRVSLPLQRGCWSRASSLDLSLCRTISPMKPILTLRSGVQVLQQWPWIRTVADDKSELIFFSSPPFPSVLRHFLFPGSWWTAMWSDAVGSSFPKASTGCERRRAQATITPSIQARWVWFSDTNHYLIGLIYFSGSVQLFATNFNII